MAQWTVEKLSFDSPVGTSQELNRFTFHKPLSSGRSGNVMVAYNRRGDPVVVKCMNKKLMRQEWVDNEVKAGSLLNHKGLVKFIEHFEDCTHNYLVVKFAKGGDLWEYMQVNEWTPIPENVSKKIFRQIVKSVHYCHQNGIVHKDIKLENVIINKKLKTTLIDFGFCEFTHPEQLSTRFDGTLDYMPPEVLQRLPFNPFKADVFALGVLLFILLTGFFPFDWKKRCEMLAKGQHTIVNWNVENMPPISNSAKNLVEIMLSPFSDNRHSLNLCLEHPWLKHKHKLLG